MLPAPSTSAAYSSVAIDFAAFAVNSAAAVAVDSAAAVAFNSPAAVAVNSAAAAVSAVAIDSSASISAVQPVETTSRASWTRTTLLALLIFRLPPHILLSRFFLSLLS